MSTDAVGAFSWVRAVGSDIRDRHVVDFVSLLIDDRHEPAGPFPARHGCAMFEVSRERYRIGPSSSIARKVNTLARHALANLSTAARTGACRPERTTCWRNRCPDLDNFSTPCRLAENASAGAAMGGPSLPRPPALHQLHLGRTRPIGPERRQYDLLNPRRGIMMRLMQSMVPTQEPPRSSFSCPRWASSGPTAPRSLARQHGPELAGAGRLLGRLTPAARRRVHTVVDYRQGAGPVGQPSPDTSPPPSGLPLADFPSGRWGGGLCPEKKNQPPAGGQRMKSSRRSWIICGHGKVASPSLRSRLP